MMGGESGIAVIGCGYWGINLARALSRLGVLRAVVDSSDRARSK
jgi:pyruvate/2-oxoglutarate dehydrogenase complex dihydrolipoamide dehydrogenase (E3) component